MCIVQDNVESNNDASPSVAAGFHTVRYALGQKVVTDAARHNSCAHRVRAFWTNAVNSGNSQKAINLTHRTTTKVWKDCLEPKFRPQVARIPEGLPFYACYSGGRQ